MTPYEMAMLYYPRLWNIDRLKALLDAGHITVREYKEIIRKEE